MNTTADVALKILPVAAVIVLAVYLISRSSTKLSVAQYEALRAQPKSPLNRSGLLSGLFWIGVGVLNFILEAHLHSRHHSAHFQEVYGAIALVLGGFYIGGAVPRRKALLNSDMSQESKKESQ